MKQGLLAWNRARQTADFQVRTCPVKGLCVHALRHFAVGEFCLEYEGDFITEEKRLENEAKYDIQNKGSYIIHCVWQGRKMAVDGTDREGTFGRLVNHARGANLKPFRLLQVSPDEPPRVALYCAKPIAPGDQLYWDYGLRTGETPFASYRMAARCLSNSLLVSRISNSNTSFSSSPLRKLLLPSDRFSVTSQIMMVLPCCLGVCQPDEVHELLHHYGMLN